MGGRGSWHVIVAGTNANANAGASVMTHRGVGFFSTSACVCVWSAAAARTSNIALPSLLPFLSPAVLP